METTITLTGGSLGEASVLIEVLSEIASAKTKHPEWPADHVSRAAIVSEEAGEVIREANHLREGKGDVRLLRSELIQTAGVCLRMIAIMDTEQLIK